VSLADAICLREGIGIVADTETDISRIEAYSILEMNDGILVEVVTRVVSRLAEDKNLFGLR
jgi:hypothetical protein